MKILITYFLKILRNTKSILCYTLRKCIELSCCLTKMVELGYICIKVFVISFLVLT